jgi:hypothetical protein
MGNTFFSIKEFDVFDLDYYYYFFFLNDTTYDINGWSETTGHLHVMKNLF